MKTLGWNFVASMLALACVCGRASAFHSIVVTLHDDTACDEAAKFRNNTCSSVVECKGNRLVIGVDGCASEVLPALEADKMTDERSLFYLRQWVGAKLGGADKVNSVEPYE